MSYDIERLGHLGDGIASGPLYAARTLPGEVVEGTVVDGRILSPRILSHSPDRVRPPCRHYNGCGGCSLLHASDGFVAAWKKDVVHRALAAQDIDPPTIEVLSSPPNSRRRATLSGRRLKNAVVVGFHARASDMVVAIPDCQVLDPALLTAIPVCEDLTRQFCSRKGEMQFAMTATTVGIDIAVQTGHVASGNDRIVLADIAMRHDLARLTWNDEVIVVRRPPEVLFDGISVVPPPGAFLQATQQGEQALQSAVAAAVGKSRKIVDLFSGCGTFALPLGRNAAVHAVDSLAELTEALESAWRKAPGLRPVTVETRDLFRRPLLPDELERFDAAVIDPPRAGAVAQTEALASSVIRRIAAVSCNPATFARDSRILIDGGFRLGSLRLVDQFRWTSHIEIAAVFTRD